MDYELLDDRDRRHRSRLWEEGKRDIVIFRLRTPKKAWRIHQSWAERLAWAGLLPIARMVEATEEDAGAVEELDGMRSRRFPFDQSLLSALVDRWRPETHTFHFRWGEMTVTLQDVACLLSLPLAGHAIGPSEPPPDWHVDLAARFFHLLPHGVAPEDVRHSAQDRHGPRLQWLKQFELEVLARANGGALTLQQTDRALEAYLLWLFGRVLFTTPHGDTIDARWIALAREIADAQNPGQVAPRSWGSAVLAHTFRALSTACYKVEGRPTLSGCPLLLQLWCYERLPIG
jgi:hypothetical protein